MKPTTARKISEVYVDPLPYSLGPLPNLVLHNPFSVAHFLWVYFFGNHPRQVKISAVFNEATNGCQVSDQEMMKRLWSMGFFGKGTLSRSEPSWFGRTARRLGLDGGEMTLEEITEQRRKKRRQFKKQRGLQEQRELQEKLKREGKEFEEVVDTDESDEELPALPKEFDTLIIEDSTKLEGKTIKQLETLELMPCEAVYLSVGLGVLDVYFQDKLMDLRQLVKAMCGNNKLFLRYVVYHYLRSLGWCVRSGVKFGTDFIVYKHGPPSHHAQFAVMILHAGYDEQRDWWWSQAVSRVVGAVRKSMVYCYVDGPNPADLDLDTITNVNSFRKTLQAYSVQSVIYSRWAPTKTRD